MMRGVELGKSSRVHETSVPEQKPISQFKGRFLDIYMLCVFYALGFLVDDLLCWNREEDDSVPQHSRLFGLQRSHKRALRLLIQM